MTLIQEIEDFGFQTKAGSALKNFIPWIKLKELIEAIKYPHPKCVGLYPVVIYFADEKEKDQFIEIVRGLKPNLTPYSL